MEPTAGEWIATVIFVVLFVLALWPVAKPKVGSQTWREERDQNLFWHAWQVTKRDHPELKPREHLRAAQRLHGRFIAHRGAEFREPAKVDGGSPGELDSR